MSDERDDWMDDISMAMAMESRIVNTENLIEIIHEANSLDYNRVYHLNDIELLDPEKIHVLRPLLIHRHVQGKPADPHMRVRAHLGLNDREEPFEMTMDIPMDWFNKLYTISKGRELLGLPPSESEGDALMNEIQAFIDGSRRFKLEGIHAT